MPVAALTSLGRDVRTYRPGLVNIYAAMSLNAVRAHGGKRPNRIARNV
jgi:hypothetical protein